jgi:hypothetical protein
MSKPFTGVINVNVTESVPDWGPYTQPIASSNDVSGEPFVDLANEARMALARD